MGSQPLSAPSMAAPVAFGQRLRQDYSGLATYVVKHSEYVSDVAGSTDFSVAKFRVNPADVFSFPWMSNIAANFEKYRFRKLKFSLKPQAPSTTPGVVMMAFDYDPTDPAPSSKADMLQYDGAVRVNSWGSQDMSMKQIPALLTSRASPTASADIRLTDAANLFIATQGQSNTNPISELWAEYEVELIIPQSQATCDAFIFTLDGWTGSVSLEGAVIANNSVNFAFNESMTAIECLRSGVYAMSGYYFSLSPPIDISSGPADELGIVVNATPVTPLYRGVGPPSSLPSQTEATVQTQINGIALSAGDVLFLTRSEPGTVRLRFAIYNIS